MKNSRFVSMRSRNLCACMLLCLAAGLSAAPDLPGISDPLYLGPVANPDSIQKFVNPLPVVKQLGIRVDAIANTALTIRMEPTAQDLLGTGQMTTVWGYGVDGFTPVTYPGSTLIAKKGVPVTITFINNLGFVHPMPMDTSFMWAFSDGPYMGQTFATNGVPAVVHLHGGHADADFDGTPEQWFTPKFHTAPSAVTQGPKFVSNIYTYDNSQEAATLWYHDHALGVTRLNTYMGLAAFYLLRDDNELGLISENKIPSGDYEIEMAIQDRVFHPNGQLAFPDVPTLPGLSPTETVEPEFFGNVILVNGKAWPYLAVEPRKYRFRMLNGSDSRFYNLHLAPDTSGINLVFTQIGSDGGLLPSPVARDTLLMGCGERYDVVVDFSDPALLDRNILMTNSANVPFPGGDPVDANCSKIMQFRVKDTTVVDPVVLPATLRPAITPLVQTGPTRQLLLAEGVDDLGRILPSLGTISDGKFAFSDPVTENIKLNDVEVWEIYNTTEDAHPIHTHLVQYQVIDRQKFTAAQDPVTMALSDIHLVGSPTLPPPEQGGWKDTEIMYPGEVTRIRAKFDKPGEYVWHCHILSHEEHDMMRPLKVEDIARAKTNRPASNAFALSQSAPNPFSVSTLIRFRLPAKGRVSLSVYNVNGQEVAKLADGYREAGQHNITWTAGDLKSGTYFCRIRANGSMAIKKLVLLK